MTLRLSIQRLLHTIARRRKLHGPIRIAVSVTCVLLFAQEYLKNLSYVGNFGDIRYFHFLWEVARTSWQRHGQIPFWNPYYCGGMVDLANPQSMALSPFNLVSFLFDAGTGMRIFILAHFVAAFLGTWVWVKSRGVHDVFCVAAAAVFLMGGFFPERSTGHVSFMAFAWLPWIVWSFEKATCDKRYIGAGACFLALCVIDGSPYGTAILTLVLVLCGIIYAVFPDHPTYPTPGPKPGYLFISALFICALGFLLVSFKLFPIIDFLRTFPRTIPAGDDALSVSQVAAIFLRRTIERHNPHYTYVFGEYRNYLGPVVVFMALGAFLLRQVRRRDVIIASVFLALLLGDWGWASPYALLHQLPIFGSLRVPARFAIVIDLFIALWFAVSLQTLWSRSSQKRHLHRIRVVVGMIAAVAIADLVHANQPLFQGVFNTPPPVATTQNPFYQTTGNSGAMFRAPVENRGYVSCYEPNPIPRAADLRLERGAQVELMPTTAGKAELSYFSPNELQMQLQLHSSATVIINQNFAPGWQSSQGFVYSQNGRIAVDVASSVSQLTLFFRPPGFLFYCFLSALSCLVLGLIVFVPHQRWVPRIRTSLNTFFSLLDTRTTRFFSVVLFAWALLLSKCGSVWLLRNEVPAGPLFWATVLSLGVDLFIWCLFAVVLELFLRRSNRLRLWVALITSIFLSLYLIINVYFVGLLGAPLSFEFFAYELNLQQALELQGNRSQIPSLLLLGFVLGGLIFSRYVREFSQRFVFYIGVTACLWTMGQYVFTRFTGVTDDLYGLNKNALIDITTSTVLHFLDRPESPNTPAANILSPEHAPPDASYTAAVPIARTWQPQHVVLWIAEGVGTRYVSLFDPTQKTTPFLESQRPHSLRFERYYANTPVSIQALFSIFCGMIPYPDFHFTTQINPRIQCHSLSEHLDDLGFSSVLLHGGFFSFTDKLRFFGDRGFEKLVDAENLPHRKNYFQNGWGIEDQALVDYALQWLPNPIAAHKKTFAAFVPIVPHYPYFLPPGTPEPFGAQSDLQRYKNGIAYTDSLLAKLYAGYEQLGIADDTLFIFVGDHGQAFGQHPRNRLHGSFVYEENIHSPLVFFNKNFVSQETVSGRLGGHSDLLATVLDILGQPTPPQSQGQSLVGDSYRYRRLPFGTFYQEHLLGFREGAHKFIWNQRTNHLEYFNLQYDPLEQTNLSNDLSLVKSRWPFELAAFQHQQKKLIENYPIMGEDYLHYLLQHASVRLIDGTTATPCPTSRDKPTQHQCHGQPAWMYVDVEMLRVFNIDRQCIRAHPPQRGSLELHFSNIVPPPRVIGAGLWDEAQRKKGGNVHIRWRIGDSVIDDTIDDQQSFTGHDIPSPLPSPTDMRVEIQSDNWSNRTTCLSFAP